MILLWFVFGIALIFGIARYNESNKLFWQLLLAFILGFSVTKMVLQINSEAKDNVILKGVNPTQVSNTQTLALIAFNKCVKEYNVVTAQPFVSQDVQPIKSDIILNKICGRVRDQPQAVLTNPPELCLVKDFSIPRDYG